MHQQLNGLQNIVYTCNRSHSVFIKEDALKLTSHTYDSTYMRYVK
jgi:hypothetical protein